MRDEVGSMTPLHVVGAAILRDDTCLVARRGEGRAFSGLWEFPGGKVEAGETPEAALAREIQEELGLTIRVLEHLGRGTADLGPRSIVLDVYEARLEHGTLVMTEHSDVRWASEDELRALAWASADVPVVPAVLQRLSLHRSGGGTPR
jgi:8-oxo-dGTP diphosphatase